MTRARAHDELLLYGGTVHTIDDDRTTAGAVLFRDGLVEAVGDAADCRAAATDPATMDLDGRVVLPGFVDAHTHLFSVGIQRVETDLSAAGDRTEALKRLSENAADTDPGEWVLGFGYDESTWPEGDRDYLTRGDLDAVSESHPVVAYRVDGHTAGLNTAALERVSFDGVEDDVITANGRPTGRVVEEAVGRVRVAAHPDAGKLRRALAAAAEHYHELGVTSVGTMAGLTAIREQYGLNDPLHVQYVDFMYDLLVNQEIGQSVATQRPVVEELALRFPTTFELTTGAVLFALAVGIPLGIGSAIYKDEAIDHGSRFMAISGVSVPQFWMAILAQLLFYWHLGWLPSGGRFPDGMVRPAEVTGMLLVDSALSLRPDAFLASAEHLLLPVVVLSLGTLAQTTRITRSSMIETLNQDYIEWSRAHGFRAKVILLKHALRNAIMPVITAVGLSYGLLLGGSVVIEIVFNIRGLGLFLYNAVLSTDFNGILGVTVVFAMGYLIVNFLVDVLHTYVDPEVEVSG